MGPERKIGNVLLQQALISTGDLWKVIKIQIEEILYSLLLKTSYLILGRFLVALHPPRSGQPRPCATLHEAR